MEMDSLPEKASRAPKVIIFLLVVVTEVTNRQGSMPCMDAGCQAPGSTGVGTAEACFYAYASLITGMCEADV